MKLRNIFTMFASLLALAFTSCEVEEGRFLDEVKVSQSYVAIPAEGGTVDVTVDAADAWEITGVPEWLTVNPAKGSAGQTVVKFTAGPATSTNEAQLNLTCAGATQVLNVIQMTEKVEPPMSTCKEVINGEDGVVYRVKGTVTSIVNTEYGNWYLEDETGSVYVYGTLYEGATKQFLKHGLEVGDIVTVEGPRKDYSGTIELVDVTVIEIEKSLIKVESVEIVNNPEEGAETPEDTPAEGEGEEEAPTVLSKTGGSVIVTLTAKGDGVSVVVPEDAKSWLSVAGVSTSGTTAVVTFNAAANAEGKRTTDLEFVTKKDGVEYKAMISLTQDGSILKVTVAEFLAKDKGTALYELTGKVTNLKTGDYGNFHLEDATGSVYVYGLTATPVAKNDKSFPTLGIKEGDVVTLVGTRDRYDNASNPAEKEQVGGPAYYISHIGHTEATVAEFLAAEVSTDVWYKLTGTVSNIVMDKADPTVQSPYGNFDLTDESGSTVYVYGLTVAPVASNDKSFPKLGIKEGDKVTLIGTRADYKGTPQVGGPAYYISHEEGAAPMPELEKSEWALVGSFNGWNAASDVYLSILDENYFVYYGFELASDTEFKFLKGGAWPPTGQEVGGNGLVEPNTIQPAGGSNIKASKAGKYDIYLSADLTKFYIMDEGKLPSEATEPAPVENSWGMMGMFADNTWVSDVPMTKEGNWIVAKGAQFTELTFKIRANASWADATNIGVVPGSEKGELNTAISVVTAADSKANHGGDAADIKLNGEAGTYDVYFSFEKMEVWVMTPGNTPGASEEPAPEDPTTLTLTNEEICAAMTSSETSYQDYTIESESGIWTVNASKNNANTYLQCRGKKGAYIKTPVFENDIKSVTIHFTDKKSVYADNTYCVFPATWTAPTEDAAYPEDGNVGKAVTDGSYSLTIPVDAGNKQVYISIIGTYAYYLDHIDVEF